MRPDFRNALFEGGGDTYAQNLMDNAAVEPMRRFWRVRQVKADGRRLKGRFSFVDTGTDVYRVFIMLALATSKKTPPAK